MCSSDLGPRSGQAQRTLVAESKLMSVAMRYSKGRLVYELRIPLATCCGQSLSEMMDHGKCLGIGFLTPVPDRLTSARQTPRMGRRGAGISGNNMPSVGGQRGGGRRGAGRNSGAMRSPMFVPFKLWIKVRLQYPHDT